MPLAPHPAADRRRTAWAAVLVLALGASAVPGRTAEVTVVVSQDAGPYREMVDGLRAELARLRPGVILTTTDLAGDTARSVELAGRAIAAQPDVVVTVGSLAARATVDLPGRPPLVAGMVLSASEVAGARGVVPVTLDFPAATQVGLLRRMLPGSRRLGVLYDPARDEAALAGLRAAAGGALDLVAIPIRQPTDLPAAFKAMAEHADVVLELPGRYGLGPEMAKPLLLFSLRNRIPVAGPSPAWARAGALYALDRDYRDVGAQCAQVTDRLLAGASADELPPLTPRVVDYVVNARTAAHMKLVLPPDVVAGAREVYQ